MQINNVIQFNNVPRPSPSIHTIPELQSTSHVQYSYYVITLYKYYFKILKGQTVRAVCTEQRRGKVISPCAYSKLVDPLVPLTLDSQYTSQCAVRPAAWACSLPAAPAILLTVQFRRQGIKESSKAATSIPMSHLGHFKHTYCW